LIRLVKYCKPEHSLLNGCRTLRLGTLQYYRELDPTFQPTADSAEGRDTIKVDSLKMETAEPDAKAAVSGVLPDMPYIHVQNIPINLTFPNSYIFCCSILSKCNREEHAARFNSEYTSYYEISDVLEFVRRIAQMLQSTITIHHFSEPVREKLGQLPIQDWGVTVGWYFNPVRYVSDKIAYINDGVMKHYVDEIPLQFRSVFVKPQKYEEDHEFRILFLIQHPKIGVLAVQKAPVDLPVLPVTEVPAALNIAAKPAKRAREAQRNRK
jgi:hypothetical protein